MSKFLILLGVLTVCLCCSYTELDIHREFQNFIKKYKKQYKDFNEYTKRYHIFTSNIRRLEDRGRYFEGVTKYMDLTPSEFREKHLNLNVAPKGNIKKREKYIPKDDPPDSYSWVDEGAVNPSRDMLNCDASYAFASVAQMETLYWLDKWELPLLSAQEIVDCDDMDAGCKGGEIDGAFMWMAMGGGVMREQDYPYTGEKGECKLDTEKTIAYPKQINSSYTPDEEEMKAILYEDGPITAAFNGNPLQFYTAGIIDLEYEECDPDDLNTAGLIVGYGTENDLDYWIVQVYNGPDFGEKGYFRVARGKGTCGINGFTVTVEIST